MPAKKKKKTENEEERNDDKGLEGEKLVPAKIQDEIYDEKRVAHYLAADQDT